MGIRGVEVALATTLVGVGLGFAAGTVLTDEPARLAGALPVPASSPSVPLDPPPTVLPDPDRPTLPTRLPSHTETVGVAPYDLEFPIPNGWQEFVIGPAEKRWTLPGNPSQSYSVRVELVISQRITIERLMEQRAEELDGLLGFNVLERTDDTLVFTYIDETDHQRLSVVRWISPRGSGTAEAEIAATGRMRDEAGLRALVARIADRAR
ncbi:hypothetical protein [Nocardioides sp.]|uniref:hypothetical protein n=1 Tax=Nocardioides sp. TaxID=35761 RepID=UPI0035635F7C